MFDFFNAASQQQRSGNAVSIPRRRYGIKALCRFCVVSIFCGAILLLAGHYSHLLYLAWFTPEQPVTESPYKVSTQRYFYKKQPLPEMADIPATEPLPVDDEQPEESEAAENSEAEPVPDNQTDLRERVEQALKDMRP